LNTSSTAAKPLIQRCAFAGTILALALIIAVLNQQARNPLVQLAQRTLSERAFGVSLKTLPVGQLVQHAHRTRLGDYEYASELAFQLSHAQPVRVTEQRRFQGQPPFQLISANQSDNTNTTTTRVDIAATDEGLSALIHRGRSDEQPRIQPLEWRYGLTDYLAVEQWLTHSQPVLGASQSFRSIDFSKLDLVTNSWTYLGATGQGTTGQGHLVTKSSPQDDVRMYLDKNFRPLSFSMAGTFELNHVPLEVLPIATEPVFHSQTYQISIDKSIDNHTNTSVVTLAVKGNSNLVKGWAGASASNGGWLIEGRRGPVRAASPTAMADYGREELSYPISHPTIKRLAAETGLKNLSHSRIAHELTAFVNGFITYDHHSTMQSVLDVAASRTGDCNEYAELFTTLARTLGVPARTVIGLAYTDDPGPAFALHAWNEVLLSEQWHAFDPTWNETVVDATHIVLPSDQGGLLIALTSLQELEFGLVAVQHLL